MNVMTTALKNLALTAESKATDIDNRAAFHLTPPVGRLNDPNGLCQDKDGFYHIFYQYAPFDPRGGLVMWGHYRTRDFMTYDHLPPAIYPDIPQDIHGAYSGSALIDDDGKMLIYYTGNVKLPGNYDYIYNGREHNTIIVESDDGLHFSEKRVIMTNDNDPDDISAHLRDPKVWKEGKKYFMVQGARTSSDKGVILLYRSWDKYHWELIRRIETSKPFGYMWECPDFFRFGTRPATRTQVLSFSPQGIKPNGFKYNNIYQSGYMFLDGSITGEYSLSEFHEYDHGFDFYAPQTFRDNKGRRIMIGWMGMPEDNKAYYNPTVEDGWQHMLTVPRELSVVNGKLRQNPIEELNSLKRGIREIYAPCRIEKNGAFGMDLTVENELEIIIRESAKITFNNGVLSLEFINGGCGRDKRSTEVNQLRNIKILCDYTCLEIFANNGEEVFTSRFYPQSSSKLEINTAGVSGVVYGMEEFKFKKLKIS